MKGKNIFTRKEREAWAEFHDKYEKENRRVDKMIKKKDYKALNNWLKAFGRSEKGLWTPDSVNRYEKDAWL